MKRLKKSAVFAALVAGLLSLTSSGTLIEARPEQGKWRLMAIPSGADAEGFCNFIDESSSVIFLLDGAGYKTCRQALNSAKPSAGFWFYDDETSGISSKLKTAGSGSVTFDLKKGWNLIGNPFDETIIWNLSVLADGKTVDELNHALQPLVFNADLQVYEAAKSLAPHEGCFLYAPEKTTLTFLDPTIDLTKTTFAGLDEFTTISGSGGETYVADQVLVAASIPNAYEKVLAAIAPLDGMVVGHNPTLNVYQAAFPSGTDVEKAAFRLNSGDPTLSAAPNAVVAAAVGMPNDPAFNQGDAALYWGLSRIQAFEAWEIAAQGGPQVGVAVLDSGVDASNPDLAGQLLPGENFIDSGLPPGDATGHGTFVAAAIAGASNNAQGSAGVCPQCRIIPVKVCNDRGECPLYAVLNGIDWAARSEARVLNLSLSASFGVGDASRDLFEAALSKASTKSIVCAAGNGSADSASYYPGSATSCLNAAATDSSDAKASFSNFGGTVDLSAPGDSIYGPGLGGTMDFHSGTSLSAAFVSGAAGLLWTAHPDLSAAQIQTSILSGADDLGDSGLGAGRLNVYRSLLHAGFLETPLRTVQADSQAEYVRPGDTIEIVAETNLASDAGVLFSWSASGGALLSGEGASVQWTVPTAAGSYKITVEAADAAGHSALDVLTVIVADAPSVLSSIVVSPQEIALETNGSIQFDAQGIDQYGDPYVIAPKWSATAAIGSIDTAGKFTATAPGEGTVTASVGETAAAARVVVTDATVDPSAAQLTSVWTDSATTKSNGVALGDYDGDGFLDLLTANGIDAALSSYVYEHNGSTAAPGFTTAPKVWTSASAKIYTKAEWGDYDGDGNLDFIIGNVTDSNVFLLKGDGAGGFTSTTITQGNVVSADWGDYDMDGDMDILFGINSNTSGQEKVYKNSAGSFSVSYVFSNNDFTSDVKWGDYDQDGYPDIGIGNPKNVNNYIHHNGGDGTFSQVFAGESLRTLSVAWGDYDGDGDLDIAFGFGGSTAGADPTGDANPEKIYVYNSVAETFSLSWTGGVNDRTYAVEWGDMDLDGDLDLLSGDRTETSRIYLCDSGATAPNPHADWVMTSEVTFDANLGDADNDGDLDVIVGNYSTADKLYRNGTSTANSDPTSPTLTAEPDYVAGKTTLAWTAGSDAQTPAAKLTYDLRVGTSSGGCEIFCGLFQNNGASPKSRGLGNTGPGLSHGITLPEGAYYWSARTVDTAFNRSAFPAEDSFVLQSIFISDLTSTENESTTSAEWADYDNDGDLDVFVGGYGVANRVYRNNAGTSIASVWTSTETDQTMGLDWGDYDNDGDLDIAVANGDAAAQADRIYRNDGGGAFTLVWSASTSEKSYDVEFGDYDQDGDLDLGVAVHGGTGGPNRLYRNDGSSSFTSVWTSTLSSKTASWDWGDSDNDGDLDFLVANIGTANNLYANSSLSFAAAATWSSSESENSYDAVFGDYDNDGDLDQTVANYGQVNRVYANSGGNSFTSIWASSDTLNTTRGDWGDYDNDGLLDIAFANDGGANQAFHNGGGGSFTKTWTSTETEANRWIDFGDYNGDGDLDLLVSSTSAAEPVRIYKNRYDPPSTVPTAPTLTAESDVIASSIATTVALAWSAGSDAETANTNLLDYDLRVGTTSGGCEVFCGKFPYRATQTTAMANGFGNVGHTLSSNIVLSPGAYYWSVRTVDSTYRRSSWAAEDSFVISPLFEVASTSAEAESAEAVSWGDYDNDGDLDQLVGNYSQTNRVYRNNGSNAFASVWTSTETDKTSSVDWGDYDGDGDIDQLVGNDTQANRVYRNDGGGSFTSIWSSAETEKTFSVAWGDYDRDGDLDQLVGNGNGAVANRIYRNDGGGSFSSVWTSTETDSTYSVAWGDYDDDGDIDQLIGNYGQANRVYRNASGSFTAIASTTETENTLSVRWGDYDGDGDLDQLTGNYGQVNRIYRNNGNHTFTAIWASTETDNTESVDWGDYDGDGDFDQLVGNSSSQNNRVYQNGGAGTFALVWTAAESNPTQSVRWGDSDGDNDLDQLVGNGSATANRVYKNNLNPTNTAPVAPNNPDEPNGTTGLIDLVWTGGSDAETTDDDLLMFDVRVGTTSGGCEIFCGHVPTSGASPRANWYGNVGATRGVYLNLPNNGTYYWAARAVDATFRRGAWTAEDTFTLDSCPNVTSTADSGNGTLRTCINYANSNPGTTITFDATVANSTITLASALPTITAAGTVVDGVTGTPNIRVDGNNGAYNCFTITSASNVVKGLTIVKCGTTTQAAVNINGAAATGNTIIGNYIGTNSAGAAALSNNYGILIDGGANANNIGGTGAGEANVVSNNSKSGIVIGGAGSDSNVVIANYIGTNSADSAAVGNSQNGVLIQGGAESNVVGGTTAAKANVISGNAQAGVLITGSGTSSNSVVGNYIGTNNGGSSALANDVGVQIASSASSNTIGGDGSAGNKNTISGNTTYGVYVNAANSNLVQGNHIGLNTAGSNQLANGIGIGIDGGSDANQVGGSSASNLANVISGNTSQGVLIDGAGTDGNLVYGNNIGLNVTQTTIKGNGAEGIAITGGAANTVVGSSAAGMKNIISGNTTDGVSVDNSDGTVIKNNYIGLDGAGTAAKGNLVYGIHVLNTSANTTIGGNAADEGNYISGNGDSGIHMDNATTTTVKGNDIGLDTAGAALQNTAHGILLSNGATSNVVGGTTAGDGNEIARNGQDGIFVTGNTTDGNRFIRNSFHDNGDLGIDLGPNGVAANDAGDTDTGPNQDMNYPDITYADKNAATDLVTVIGTLDTASPNLTVVDVYISDTNGAVNGEGETYIGSATPDAAGAWTMTATVPALNVGDYVTATATDNSGSGNTSEFAVNEIVVAASTCPVVSVSSDTGNSTLRDCITKANSNAGADTISFSLAAGSVITLASALPALTDATGGTTIAATGSIRVDGAGLGFDGLVIRSNNNTVNGLILTRFKGTGTEGGLVLENSATGNTIKNCVIGTNASNAAGLGNQDGLIIRGGASSNIIGPGGEPNVLSGNLGYGLRVTGSGTDSNLVYANYIGVNVSGAGGGGLGNNIGVQIDAQASGNVIGGVTTVRNIISDNASDGAVITGAGTDGNTIQNNYIGIDSAGAQAANGGVGLKVASGASSSTIGGSNVGNVISGNASHGIQLDAASSNSIPANWIGTNIAGTAAIANGGDGVNIVNGSDSNSVGGTFPNQNNVISGNTGAGVRIDASDGNTVKTNTIGANEARSAGIPNANGVVISGGSLNNKIGSVTANEHNVIAYNTGKGVIVTGAASIGNALIRNKIYSNGTLGIDLGDDGITANDAGDADAGANNLINFPVITYSAIKNGTTTISGTLDTGALSPANTVVSLYISDGAAGSNGQATLWFADAVPAADGTWSVTSTTPSLGDIITAVATDYTGSVYLSSSEFAVNAEVESDTCPVVSLSSNSGVGSLRDCIDKANSNAGADVISFSLPAGTTISLTSALPALTDATGGTTINATGSIRIDGGGGGFDGIEIQSDDNTIDGLIITRFSGSGSAAGIHITNGTSNNTIKNSYIGTNATSAAALGNDIGVLVDDASTANSIGLAAEGNVISGNGVYGAQLTGAGTSGNFVYGNGIGIDAAGTAALANDDGIVIDGSAAANIIGGTAAGEGNGISGNASAGIRLNDSDNNVIRNNIIGLDSGESAALANDRGVVIENGSSGNQIGGDGSSSEGNIVSGNTLDGILIDDASTNTIIGNNIGLDSAGTSQFGNGTNGISLTGASTNNTIGSSTSGEFNIISANGGAGIYIFGPGASGTTINGNLIGTDGTGAADFGNTGDGIDIVDGDATIIGGSLAGEANTISGNGGDGIGVASSNVTILGNNIGVDNASSGALGNDGHGIHITAGTGSTIGGSAAGEPNTIAYNGGDGVYITGANSDQHALIENIHHDNAGLGIDLNQTGNGADVNDAGDADAGPNQGQNYPVISTALRDPFTGTTAVSGTLDSVAPLTAYTVSIYQADASSAVNGEGETHLADATPDATGAWSALIAGLNVNDWITAIVRDSSGNTSEFSLNVIVDSSTSCPIVSDSSDSNPSSLRDCITRANASAGADVISFSLPAGTVITLASALPALSDASGGTTITATGSIVVSGAGLGFDGLTLQSDDNTIDGLALTNFSGGGTNAGIVIDGSSGNVVKSCAIGTDFSDAAGVGNDIGVRIENGASGNTVGGDNNPTSVKNIISGNSAYGVFIAGNGTDSNIVDGNYIGVDSAGTAPQPNGIGIQIENQAASNVIGSITGSTLNIVSGNTSHGIVVTGAGTTGNLIHKNYIGPGQGGASVGGNGGVGILLDNGSSGTFIGNNAGAAGAGNEISGNGSHGIEISASDGNTVRYNKVGVDVAGTAAMPNGGDGINLNGGSSGNGIGGTTYYDGNVFSGNTQAGVRITGAGTDSNTVRAFYIGLDETGAISIPNGEDGVAIENGASSNTIGSTSLPSLIANNSAAGAIVSGAATLNNRITGTAIYDNSGGADGQGIDLGDDGTTANDAGDGDAGPNNLMNFPVLNPVGYNFTTGITTVSGSLDTASPSSAVVQVFRAKPSSAQNGQADLYLGQATVNGSGAWSFSTNTQTFGTWFTATAISSSGNTSEFALNEESRIGSAPSGLAAVMDCPDVVLTWSASDHPDFDRYTLFRSLTSGSGYATVATGIATTTYRDTYVGNDTYYYVVQAYKSTETSNVTPLSAEAVHVQTCPMFVCRTFGEYQTYFLSPGADLEPQALYHPMDAVFDNSNNLWVTSRGHHKLKYFDSSGNILSPPSPVGSFGGGDGQFDDPTGLGFDGTNLYVADRDNGRISLFDPTSGAWIKNYAVAGKPVDVGIDGSGNLYVSTMENKLKKFTSAGVEVTSGWPVSINGPRAVYVDASGQIWVVSETDSKIYVYDASGAIVSSWGTYGSGLGQLKAPWGIVIDEPNSIVYVTDRGNHRLNSYDLSGTYIDTWGAYGTSGNEYFNYPAGMALLDDEIYLMDEGNWKVQRFCN